MGRRACTCSTALSRAVINPTAPEGQREWRADLIGSDSKGQFMPTDVTTKIFFPPSCLAPRPESALSRTEVLLKGAEMQKKRVPNIMTSILERNAISIPLALSVNGALG